MPKGDLRQPWRVSNEIRMRHPCVVTIGLVLAGCSSEPPQPSTSDVSKPAASSLSAPAVFDAHLAALPVRPAGAALAVASQEHALVRRLPAHQLATAGDPLAVRVLAVQAAYRRWCAGDPLSGDGPLLAEAGGVHLPGAIACQSPPLGQPRPLIPESGRFHAGENPLP